MCRVLTIGGMEILPICKLLQDMLTTITAVSTRIQHSNTHKLLLSGQQRNFRLLCQLHLITASALDSMLSSPEGKGKGKRPASLLIQHVMFSMQFSMLPLLL